MYPILFSIGRVHIYNHGLMMVLGALLGGVVIFFLAKGQGKRTEFVLDLVVYCLLAGLVGARLLYIIIYFNQFAGLREMLLVWYGGLVSFGGFLGGGLFAYYFLKRKKENIKQWFDLGIIGLMVAWAIGRIGCLLNGDSYGVVSYAKIAIWGRIPTQLLETIWCAIVAGFLYLLYSKKIFRSLSGRLPEGGIFWLGLGLYGLGRFVIDFWRDEQIFVVAFKAGQWASLLLLIISAYFFWRLLKPRKEVIARGLGEVN